MGFHNSVQPIHVYLVLGASFEVTLNYVFLCACVCQLLFSLNFTFLCYCFRFLYIFNIFFLRLASLYFVLHNYTLLYPFRNSALHPPLHLEVLFFSLSLSSYFHIYVLWHIYVYILQDILLATSSPSTQ